MNFFWIAIGILIIAFAVYKIAVNSFTDYFLGNVPQKLKAVIIDHKNYLPNQRVRAEFTYSYQFDFNGKNIQGILMMRPLKLVIAFWSNLIANIQILVSPFSITECL